jgi:hypothetical protein
MVDLKKNTLKEKDKASLNKKYCDFFIIQISIKYFNSRYFQKNGSIYGKEIYKNIF